MTGVLGLAGGGEFLNGMEPADRRLLAPLQGEARRVVLLPTAAAQQRPERAVETARRYFRSLDVTVEPALILTRPDAADPRWLALIAAAPALYLTGGDPVYLLETLRDTPAWAATVARYQADGILIGSSAGAMVLCEWLLVPDGAGPPSRWTPGLGLVKASAVAPHFDTAPPAWRERLAATRPAGSTLLGIDERTALVQAESGWLVLGRGSVTVYPPDGAAVTYPPGGQVAEWRGGET